MNSLDIKIRRESIKTSLMLGSILIVLNVFLFYLTTSISKSPLIQVVIAPPLLSRVIPIIIAVLFCIRLRKRIGGYWTFKQATTGIFILFFSAYLMNVIGNDIIFDKFIEPHSSEKLQTAYIGAKIMIGQQKHSSEKDITRSVSDLKKEFPKNPSIGDIIQSYAIVILFLFLLALIFASLIRNAEYVPAGNK